MGGVVGGVVGGVGGGVGGGVVRRGAGGAVGDENLLSSRASEREARAAVPPSHSPLLTRLPALCACRRRTSQSVPWKRNGNASARRHLPPFGPSTSRQRQPRTRRPAAPRVAPPTRPAPIESVEACLCRFVRSSAAARQGSQVCALPPHPRALACGHTTEERCLRGTRRDMASTSVFERGAEVSRRRASGDVVDARRVTARAWMGGRLRCVGRTQRGV